MSTHATKVSDELTAVLRKHLTHVEANDSIDEERDLYELGLDSMKSIALLLDLESAFNVVIPDEYLTADNYRTLGRLRSMIRVVVGEEPAG